MNRTTRRKTAMTLCLSLALVIGIIMAAPAYAIIMTPTTTTAARKPACQSENAATNPFCPQYNKGATPFKGTGGWKVATGVINLGTPTSSRNRWYGRQVLPGLAGLVTQRDDDEKPMTLSEKADLKYTPVKKEGKYMSLLDYIRERDAASKPVRR